jgi:hypothetical protein
LRSALAVLQAELAGAERLDWSRVIVDASLVEAKKGAKVVVPLTGAYPSPQQRCDPTAWILVFRP